jgi:arylsulfatase A-like enzyme
VRSAFGGGAAIFLVLTLAGAAVAFDPSAPRPNILFIMVDDQGVGDWGTYGGTKIATPVIDQLASEGVKYTQYYVNSSVCSPTRAALLTGRYPARFGMRDALVNDTRRGLTEGYPTLPEILYERGGYLTAHIGKWHLGSEDFGFGPERRGFIYSALPTMNTDIHEDVTYRFYDHRDAPNEEKSCDHDDPNCGFPGHITASTTDIAIRFLQDECPTPTGCSQPFFINLWFNAPHTVNSPPEGSEIPPDYASTYPDLPNGPDDWANRYYMESQGLD